MTTIGEAALSPWMHSALNSSMAHLNCLADSQLWRLLTLRDYNTRVVLAGTTLLGIASGMLGVYLLLRKRALLGDAISHATLPGVALAFLWTAISGQDKSLPVLLAGAAISGSLGGISVLLLRYVARIREDAALGIVLSVFFGAGVALVSVVQNLPRGNIAGLEGFIYGKVVAMTGSDVALSAVITLLVLGMVLILGKELKILCFDIEFARSQGWPVALLDCLLIAMVVGTTIIGLQAIGLIMVIALLITPAASSRFWTHDLNRMLAISGLLGGLSCALGAMASALFADMPSGATIVLVSCGFFLLSFALGRERGLLWSWLRNRQLRRQQDYHHLLRICYERLESAGALPGSGKLSLAQTIPLQEIAQQRQWSSRFAAVIASELDARGLIVFRRSNQLQLTLRGVVEAEAAVREHRLLELYMMEQAEAKVGQADREADYLEHALLPEHLAELEGSIFRRANSAIPPSPHPLVSPEPNDPKDGRRT
jgi:manganese/zinc/iron transport system permease protein